MKKEKKIEIACMENRAGMSSLMLVGNTMLKTKLRFAWILSQSLISLYME
jgi:hypothetical protein